MFILAHKSLTAEEQPHLVTDCEMTWMKIKLCNLQDLYAGVFYMPHRNKKDLNKLMKSLDLLTVSGTKDRNILLAGDANCPDVDWNTNTVPESSQERDIQQGLADNMSEAHLPQIHNQPTRLSAILDLVITTNPTLLKNSTSIPGISDHSIVVADFDTVPHITKEATRKKFKLHTHSNQGIFLAAWPIRFLDQSIKPITRTELHQSFKSFSGSVFNLSHAYPYPSSHVR